MAKLDINLGNVLPTGNAGPIKGNVLPTGNAGPIKGNMEDLAKLKPVRDALNDLFLLRQEMTTLFAHGQFASPDRVLKLTAKLNALGQHLAAAGKPEQ